MGFRDAARPGLLILFSRSRYFFLPPPPTFFSCFFFFVPYLSRLSPFSRSSPSREYFRSTNSLQWVIRLVCSLFRIFCPSGIERVVVETHDNLTDLSARVRLICFRFNFHSVVDTTDIARNIYTFWYYLISVVKHTHAHAYVYLRLTWRVRVNTSRVKGTVKNKIFSRLYVRVIRERGSGKSFSRDRRKNMNERNAAQRKSCKRSKTKCA